MNPETEKEKPLTPEQQKLQHQDMMDQHTIFGLAAMMMDLHTSSLMKDQNGVVGAMMRVRALLTKNPGFGLRFKQAREEAMKKAKAIVALKESVKQEIKT